MASEKFSYGPPPAPIGHSIEKQDIESEFIDRLCGLKYEYRSDIKNRATLEANFREKFETLNRVRLTGSDSAHLMNETSKRIKNEQAIYKEMPAPLSDKCFDSAFGECHCKQFDDKCSGQRFLPPRPRSLASVVRISLMSMTPDRKPSINSLLYTPKRNYS